MRRVEVDLSLSDAKDLRRERSENCAETVRDGSEGRGEVGRGRTEAARRFWLERLLMLT